MKVLAVLWIFVMPSNYTMPSYIVANDKWRACQVQENNPYAKAYAVTIYLDDWHGPKAIMDSGEKLNLDCHDPMMVVNSTTSIPTREVR